MHRAKRITILVVVGLMAACGSAQGDYLLFTNRAPEGASWFNDGNWLFHLPFSTGHTPTITNTTHISSEQGPVTAIVDGPGAVAGSLMLGWATGHQSNLTLQPGSELYVPGSCYVGYYSPAQFVITGGVFSGPSAMYIGHLPRTGPPCEIEVVQYAGSMFVTNGSGSVIMNNNPGTNSISGTENYAPGFPRYKLIGGLAQSGYWNVGSKGYSKVEVEGGTNKVTGHLRVGQDIGGIGEYLQSGGRVEYYRLYVGNSGAEGFCALSGGTASGSIFCGNGGTGTFVQTGGTNTAIALNIGGPATGTGHYQISGGTLAMTSILTVSTNGTLEIIGSNSLISCSEYKQTAQATLDLRLTNGVVSPIVLTWNRLTPIEGTLNVTLQGPPESYPSRSSVITVIDKSKGYSGEFTTINLAPANKLIGVRVNYNARTLTLDQWEYAPNGTLLTIR